MSLQNLFVAKLPRNLTDADLQSIFAAYSPSSAKIMLDATTGNSKGFGFVLFDSEERGEKAYKALNRKSTRACGHNFTLVIYPSNHDGKTATETSNALYIRNIPMTVPQQRVEEFLGSFGTLTYCAMREDHHGSPVWVVYAEYDTVEGARNALTKLHGNNTYFRGPAPILAKYQDSEEAKRERRKRREHLAGAHTQGVPSSGCVFPPPRPSEGYMPLPGSSLGSNTHTTTNMVSAELSNSEVSGGSENGLGAALAASSSTTPGGSYPATAFSTGNHAIHSNNHSSGNSASSPFHSTSAGNGGAAAMSPPPPYFGNNNNNSGSANMNNSGGYPFSVVDTSTPHHVSNNIHNNNNNNNSNTAFSMPQQLLRPTPGYCYTLSDSGQQIFIPATSISPPLSAGSAPQQSAMPFSAPVFSTNHDAGKGNNNNNSSQSNNGFSPLLTPPPQNPVVLMEGGQQFVLARDAINVYNANRSTTSSLDLFNATTASESNGNTAANNNNNNNANGSIGSQLLHQQNTNPLLIQSSPLLWP